MKREINNLKVNGMSEEDIYRRYINGEKLGVERGDVDVKTIKIRVKYLEGLVERYQTLW